MEIKVLFILLNFPLRYISQNDIIYIYIYIVIFCLKLRFSHQCSPNYTMFISYSLFLSKRNVVQSSIWKSNVQVSIHLLEINHILKNKVVWSSLQCSNRSGGLVFNMEFGISRAHWLTPISSGRSSYQHYVHSTKRIWKSTCFPKKCTSWYNISKTYKNSYMFRQTGTIFRELL